MLNISGINIKLPVVQYLNYRSLITSPELSYHIIIIKFLCALVTNVSIYQIETLRYYVCYKMLRY